MKEAKTSDSGSETASLVRSPRRWRALPALLVLSAGAAAFAQFAPKAASDFCYNGAALQCFDTLDKAEQAMRLASENANIASILEHSGTSASGIPLGSAATYEYAVKDQPSTFYAPTYMLGVSSGNLLSGGQGCTQGSDANRSDWCQNEADLVAKVMEKYRQKEPNCTFGAPYVANDFRISPYSQVKAQNIGFNTYGVVDYGDHQYATNRTCNGTSGLYYFRIRKESTYSCPYQFSRLGDTTPNDGNGDLTLPILWVLSGCSQAAPCLV